MAKYVQEQKYMWAGLKKRKAQNRGLVWIILLVKSDHFLRSLGLCQSAAINSHPNYSGTLHRNLNASVPDPTFPSPL